MIKLEIFGNKFQTWSKWKTWVQLEARNSSFCIHSELILCLNMLGSHFYHPLSILYVRKIEKNTLKKQNKRKLIESLLCVEINILKAKSDWISCCNSNCGRFSKINTTSLWMGVLVALDYGNHRTKAKIIELWKTGKIE